MTLPEAGPGGELLQVSRVLMNFKMLNSIITSDASFYVFVSRTPLKAIAYIVHGVAPATIHGQYLGPQGYLSLSTLLLILAISTHNVIPPKY